jgi:hypothetical protein
MCKKTKTTSGTTSGQENNEMCGTEKAFKRQVVAHAHSGI